MPNVFLKHARPVALAAARRMLKRLQAVCRDGISRAQRRRHLAADQYVYQFDVADHAGLTNSVIFSDQWFVVVPEPIGPALTAVGIIIAVRKKVSI